VIYLLVATTLRTIPRRDMQALLGAIRHKARRATVPATVENIPTIEQESLESFFPAAVEDVLAFKQESLESFSPASLLIEAEEDPEITEKRPLIRRDTVMPEVSG
jgi:hypothetical protein